MKKFLIVVTSLLLSACASARVNEPAPTDASAPTPVEQQSPTVPPTPIEKEFSDLPELGKAPELENQVWLNTDVALRLADLRGQVVLLDMWTFG